MDFLFTSFHNRRSLFSSNGLFATNNFLSIYNLFAFTIEIIQFAIRYSLQMFAQFIENKIYFTFRRSTKNLMRDTKFLFLPIEKLKCIWRFNINNVEEGNWRNYSECVDETAVAFDRNDIPPRSVRSHKQHLARVTCFVFAFNTNTSRVEKRLLVIEIHVLLPFTTMSSRLSGNLSKQGHLNV